MRNIDEYVIYRRDVCKIVDIKDVNNIKYYVLVPMKDKSLRDYVPVNTSLIKDLMTPNEVDELINKISNIELIDIDDRRLEQKYKELLDSGNHEDLIKIIKTTYLRNKKRTDNKKKISERDKNYFELAEQYLYEEISIVLNMNIDKVKDYIIKKLELS